MLIFIVSGFALSELLFIGSKSEISNVNNGGWFSVQSIYLSGFFLMYFLATIKNTLKRRLFTALIIILSFTGTLTFLFEFRNNEQFITISANELALSEFIKQETLQSAIILEPLKHGPSLVSHLSGRNTPITIYRTFLPHIASKSIIKERQKNVVNFYDNSNTKERRKIINQYNIDYFIVPKVINQSFNAETLGEKIFDNNDYFFYQVNNS
jgi:hypothetical protein